MPKHKDFRVIPGGKPSAAAAADTARLDGAELLARARRYRSQLSQSAGEDAEGLVADFEDAIAALLRLEQSSQADAAARAAEYRRLVAELDGEIAAALQVPPPA